MVWRILTPARVLVLAFVCIASAAWAASTSYSLLKEASIAGDDGWDYLTVDSSSHRVFVSHGTHVVVLDGESGAQVGEIPDTPGVHGIAIAKDLGKGFVSNGRGNTITIFDLKTLKPLGQIPAGENPDAILYDPASSRVFAFNGRSKNATVADAKSGTVAGTIALPGKPEFGVADGKGHVYVNIEDKNQIVAIDTKSLTATAKWDLGGCDSPSGLAMDREHRLLFSVCDGKVMTVTDADSGKQVTKLTIGDGPDAAVFDPQTHLAFSPNGQDGTLTIFREDSPNKFSLVQTVQTRRGARTMAEDESTGKLYLVAAQFGPAAAPSAANPRPRPTILPNSVKLLIYGPK